MPWDLRSTTNGPNILAESVLERVRQALSEDWIGGLHLSPFPEAVVFRSFDVFLSCVMSSLPGFTFTLWSISEMRRRGLLLIDNQYEDAKTSGDSLLSLADIERLRSYLTDKSLNEIFAIVSTGGEELEVFWTDLDEEVLAALFNAARRAVAPGGRICAFPFTQVDSPEFYLVDAKRPNEKGEVP
ncbi:MAG: hypothetical protein WBE72_12940 [Terracidiphilus sp.]